MNRSVVEFAADLVRIPSVLGDEGRVAEAVRDEMTALSFDRVEIDDAGNAIGVVEGVEPGPTILFDAHMDTVDVLPRERWTHDPFGAEIVDGRMYGRGTSDMKGALAAMVHGVGGVDRSKLKGRAIVSASVGEELVEGAALRHVLERYPADFVVIGESSNLNVVHAGRGRAEFVVTTHGTPAHGSVPHLGDNAVLKMLEVVREIEAMEMRKHPVVGSGVMALTDIISQPYPAHSVIPSGCRATYERRTLPGETRESLLVELTDACARAGAPETTIQLATSEYTSYTGVEWTQPKWFPAWETSVEHPLVVAAMQAVESIGQRPLLSSYQFCTNAAYSAGEAGIPTIGLGPSDERLAHTINEYIEVEQIELAAKAYGALAAGI